MSASGGPVRGGNLVFANPQDAQSMDESTIFDNNSIWILEQIFQPLYTVTDNGKGVEAVARDRLHRVGDGLTYTFTLRKGVKFSTGQPMTSGRRQVLAGADDGRVGGLGLHRRGDQVRRRPRRPTPS